MIGRLILAWRRRRGGADGSLTPPVVCARCAELAAQVTYWRAREERTADALLIHLGIGRHVAAAPAPTSPNPMAAVMRAIGVTEVDLSKSPGQGEMRGDT